MLLLLACVDPDANSVRLGDPREASPTVPVAGTWASPDDTLPAASAPLGFGRDPDADLGPLSVFSTEDGIALLDQENRRIVRYDAEGAEVGTTPIPSRTTLDAASDGDGFALLAYDRETISWSAQRIDANGSLLTTAPVPLDAPSGIFLDGDTVLVEQAHGRLYDPATGVNYPGRPTGDGRYVSAEKVSSERLVLTWSNDSEPLHRTVLTPDRPLGNVVALQSRDGYTLVTLFLFEEGPAPDYEMIRPELRSVLLDSNGERVDEVSLPPGAETILTRELALGPQGALWRLRTDISGLALDRLPLEVR